MPAKEAERDAQQILRKVWTDGDLADIPLPVDPFLIAKKLGLRVYTDYSLDPDISGMLIKASGYDDPEILLNGQDSRNRQRFTCAHELGHYNRRSKAADDDPWEYIDKRDSLASRGDDPDEVYANQFAAELLMPREAVKAKWPDDVPVLAIDFGVSQDAMTFRLRNLGLLK
jgi:Zn-dependent peptidase ImmA (M78 family)